MDGGRSPFNLRGLRQPADAWQSSLVPLNPQTDRRAWGVVGERWAGYEGGLKFGTPPIPTGRVCVACPTVLSRWNESGVCGPCERANRYVFPPVDYTGTVVYYAVGADPSLVKIGASKRVAERLKQLHASLLCAEPGGFAREAERHRQFAQYRRDGEWFVLAGALAGHVDQLKAA